MSTTQIAYVGRDDLRILAAADLHKVADITGFHKTSFAKGQPVEVDAEVAAALLGNPDLFGTFAVVEQEAPAEVEEKADGEKADKKSK